jgi:glycosyltransferase involved in cell wall biosynthesis
MDTMDFRDGHDGGAGDGVAGAGRAPRVAVLWDSLSGYVHAELAALAEAGADLLVYHRTVRPEAPFNQDDITRAIEARAWSVAPDEGELQAELARFDPDALMIISWNNGVYRRTARRWAGRTLRILCMSNQWASRAKQWGGLAISRFVIRPAYDAALVTGDRAADFAERLGFSSTQLVWGMNTADYPVFAKVAAERGGETPPEAFLFVGRLVPDKAIDVLAEGYRRYRRSVSRPWPLRIAGTGPQDHLMRGLEGVEMLGFVQPDELPGEMARAGCLVLPSRFEPWGVAIHEATAAGLPVVCTRECGASTRLVLDGYNGVVISKDDPEALVDGLVRITEAGDDARRAMGAASRGLALQYSPQRWAANLLTRIPELRARAGLEPTPWRASRRSAVTEHRPALP